MNTIFNRNAEPWAVGSIVGLLLVIGEMVGGGQPECQISNDNVRDAEDLDTCHDVTVGLVIQQLCYALHRKERSFRTKSKVKVRGRRKTGGGKLKVEKHRKNVSEISALLAKIGSLMLLEEKSFSLSATFSRLGGTELVLLAMRLHGRDIDVQLQCLVVLSRVLTGCPMASRTVVDKGGLQATLLAMERFPFEAQVQASALAALARMLLLARQAATCLLSKAELVMGPSLAQEIPQLISRAIITQPNHKVRNLITQPNHKVRNP